MNPANIKDLWGIPNAGANQIPAAAESWLPGMAPDSDDAARLDWLNQHGRVGVCQSGFYLILPCGIDGDWPLPESYNVRNIIDLARGVIAPLPPLSGAESAS